MWVCEEGIDWVVKRVVNGGESEKWEMIRQRHPVDRMWRLKNKGYEAACLLNLFLLCVTAQSLCSALLYVLGCKWHLQVRAYVCINTKDYVHSVESKLNSLTLYQRNRYVLKQAQWNEPVKCLIQTFTSFFLRELALQQHQVRANSMTEDIILFSCHAITRDFLIGQFVISLIEKWISKIMTKLLKNKDFSFERVMLKSN